MIYDKYNGRETIQNHYLEEQTEQIVLRFRSNIQLLESLQQTFKDPNDMIGKQLIQRLRIQIRTDIIKLQKFDIDILDIISSGQQEILKAKILKARDFITNAEMDGEKQVFDLIDEDIIKYAKPIRKNAYGYHPDRYIDESIQADVDRVIDDYSGSDEHIGDDHEDEGYVYKSPKSKARSEFSHKKPIDKKENVSFEQDEEHKSEGNLSKQGSIHSEQIIPEQIVIQDPEQQLEERKSKKSSEEHKSQTSEEEKKQFKQQKAQLKGEQPDITQADIDNYSKLLKQQSVDNFTQDQKNTYDKLIQLTKPLVPTDLVFRQSDIQLRLNQNDVQSYNNDVELLDQKLIDLNTEFNKKLDNKHKLGFIYLQIGNNQYDQQVTLGSIVFLKQLQEKMSIQSITDFIKQYIELNKEYTELNQKYLQANHAKQTKDIKKTINDKAQELYKSQINIKGPKSPNIQNNIPAQIASTLYNIYRIQLIMKNEDVYYNKDFQGTIKGKNFQYMLIQDTKKNNSFFDDTYINKNVLSQIDKLFEEYKKKPKQK